MLDEKLLAKATQLLGLKTYSATVNKALEESVRITLVEGLHKFQGTNMWQGDLAEMREDNPRRPERRKRAAR